MDSKLDSNKDEKSNVTENDASKAKTSRIKRVRFTLSPRERA